MDRVGVDIGGSTVRAALVDEHGYVLRSDRRALSATGFDDVVTAAAALVRAVSHDAGPVGVAVAGMLRGGVVVNAPNLGWREQPLGDALKLALGGRPVRLVNDLSAAAWGEHVAGASRGVADVLTVFVGTGVGSAIIAGGRLLQGATGVAAELGHVKVTLDGGRPCGCGQRGCLEAYAGGGNLRRWMAELGLAGEAADLERLAVGGDPKARALYAEAFDALALAIANQVTVLNPKLVVLGGGVLARCPGAVERIRAVIQARAAGPAASAVQVVSSALGDDSGLVGAAVLSADARV